MRDLSNELRKIAREQWDELQAELQAEVDEKELKRLNIHPDKDSEDKKSRKKKAFGKSSKHGPNVQALIDKGLVKFDEFGNALFPVGEEGAEQSRKYFEACDKDQELESPKKHGPNVQALIDKGLVSFGEDGSVTFSPKMSVYKLGPMLLQAQQRDKDLERKK